MSHRLVDFVRNPTRKTHAHTSVGSHQDKSVSRPHCGKQEQTQIQSPQKQQQMQTFTQRRRLVTKMYVCYESGTRFRPCCRPADGWAYNGGLGDVRSCPFVAAYFDAGKISACSLLSSSTSSWTADGSGEVRRSVDSCFAIVSDSCWWKISEGKKLLFIGDKNNVFWLIDWLIDWLMY